MGSFPVVLYRGPPSPTLPAADPPDIEEFTPLSKENRTIRVSPSFTIELVDDEEDDADTVAGLSQAVKAATMSDDDE